MDTAPPPVCVADVVALREAAVLATVSKRFHAAFCDEVQWQKRVLAWSRSGLPPGSIRPSQGRSFLQRAKALMPRVASHQRHLVVTLPSLRIGNAGARARRLMRIEPWCYSIVLDVRMLLPHGKVIVRALDDSNYAVMGEFCTLYNLVASMVGDGILYVHMNLQQHAHLGVSRSWMRLQPLIDLLDELLVEKSRFVTLFPMPTM